MKENISKSILGLNQRIPLAVLKEALIEELNGGMDDQHLLELCQGEYAGDNRAAKAVREVKSTIKGSSVMPLVIDKKNDVLQALKSQADCNAILTAIICGRYSFCFDVLSAFGKQFRLQDEVNTSVINRILGAKYGMNKNCNNTLYYAVPQFVEAGVITRSKPGLYTPANALVLKYAVSWNVWKESFYVNNSLYNRNDKENLCFEPYFTFVKKDN